MAPRLRTINALLFVAFTTGAAAQCTNYTITVGGGFYDIEIDWELVNDIGATVALGGAPTTQSVCLPDGCYTMYMYDSFGDGWNGGTFVIREQPANTIVSSGTLNNGYLGTQQVDLGGACGTGNCDTYTMVLTSGSYPTEVSWNLIGGTTIVATGFAPTNVTLCLDTGCYVMQMFDSFGDGWNGATWALYDANNAVVQSGTLGSGSIGQATIPLDASGPCSSSGPVTASDCPDAVNICTNYNFQIDPNGEGAIYEIPALGSYGNPDFLLGDGINSPWGSDNYGCLRNDELNSTWMIINIWGGGSLEFTFGGLGTQAGFYDWIMYPYDATTCTAIVNNNVAPVRCNWNASSFGGTGLASSVPAGGVAGNFEPPLTVATGDQYIICFSNWSSVSTLVPLEFGGTAIVSCDQIVLPIELIDMTAIPSTQGIDLAWHTATETGVLRFDVGRSEDLSAWSTIGGVPAGGNSATTMAYSFRDGAPISGTQFYRLDIIDTDGHASHGPIVSAAWELPGPLIVPNPNDGLTWVSAPAGTIDVLDVVGRRVPWRTVQQQDGRTRIQIEQRGLFLVRARDGEQVRGERMIVR
ncbi:MAG: hypothetical protein H6595_00085 [Flavobacteriales bacterium]|nr:hypothetical protein [Flavobacteriales bacterium]MCB9165857.1 hypothetical protein [Flavobacteriales bacterium]